MYIYIGEFIYICVLGLFLFNNKNNIESNKYKKIYLFLVFVLLAIIMGSRDVSVGTDTRLYETIFMKYGSIDNIHELLNEGTTIIWALYNHMVFSVFGSYRFMLYINAFLICGLCAKFIYDNSDNVALSTIFFLAFYHYFSAFNISRQYLAIMISINSFKYIKENKLFKFSIANLLAILIHNTSFCTMILVILFYKKVCEPKNIKWILMVTLVMSILYDKLLNIFIVVFPHYNTYFDTNTYFQVAGQGKRVLVTLLYLVIFLYTNFTLLKKKKNLQERKKIEMLNIINLISIIIGIVSLNSVVLARFERYFAIYIIILIPSIITNIKKDKIGITVIIIIITIIPMFAQLNANNSQIIPYVIGR